MFVDQTDFNVTPYIIPNQVDSRDLQDYIDAKETFYLKKILGIDLYREFIEGLETSGVIESKWLNLQWGTNEEENPDGSGDFEYCGITYEYLGMKEMLKPLIYSDWVRDNYRKLTSAGVVTPTAQNNSTAVLPDVEVVHSWNDFVNHWITMHDFILSKPDDYTWNPSKYFSYKNTLDI